MKKRLHRELFWMSLPIALLAGGALWINLVKSPLPIISRAFTNATSPVLSVEEISGGWSPPVVSAVGDDQEGCSVSAIIQASNAWSKTSATIGPSFKTTDVVDEKGRSLLSFYGKSRVLPSGRMSGIVSMSNGTTATGYRISAFVPVAALPRTVRNATFIGTVGWGTAKPVQVKFQVIPPWMRRPAKRLRIERVTWQPYPKNKGSEVEVICSLINSRNLNVFPCSVDLPYYPELQGGAKRPPSDTILANWSQRIESGDGRLNSLNLLQKHIHKDRSAFYSMKTKTYSQAVSLETFDPLCQVTYSNIKNGRVRLTYSISGVPQFFKAPIFRCEIYLVGDGVISVSCPLKSKPSKQSR